MSFKDQVSFSTPNYFGLSYSYKISNSQFWLNLLLRNHYKRFSENKPFSQGNIEFRRFLESQIGVNYTTLFINRRAYLGLSLGYRHGVERYFIENSPIESHYLTMRLRQFGISSSVGGVLYANTLIEVILSLRATYFPISTDPYPGKVLYPGNTNKSISISQTFLSGGIGCRLKLPRQRKN